MVRSLSTPATVPWWAFLLVGLLGWAQTELAPAWAQSTKRYRPLPDYVQIGEPDQAEGRKILQEFRGLGLAGDQYWEFNLRFLPRRGPEVVVPGALWSSREGEDTLTRIVLRPAGTVETRLLLRNGPQPRLWAWTPGTGDSVRIDESRWFQPLQPTNLRPFDLLMPYLFWPEYVFEGVARLHERPAHRFLMYPPKELALAQPDLAGVRLSLDTQFRALVQSEIIGAQGRATRTLALLNLKKVGEQWLAKWVDVRDEVTRDKTRIELTAVAQGAQFSRVVFEPATLAEDIRPPAADTCIHP